MWLLLSYKRHFSFFVTWSFIILFSRSRHWIQSWSSRIQSTPLRPLPQKDQLHYPPIYPYVFEVVSSLQVFRLTFCTHFSSLPFVLCIQRLVLLKLINAREAELQYSHYYSKLYVSELKKNVASEKKKYLWTIVWSFPPHFSRHCNLCSLGLDTVSRPPWIDPNYWNEALQCNAARPPPRNFRSNSQLWIRSVFLGRGIPMLASKRTNICLWWLCKAYV
jgi:hypothetical protein